MGIGPSYGAEFAKMRKIAPRLHRAGLDPGQIQDGEAHVGRRAEPVIRIRVHSNPLLKSPFTSL